MPDFRLIQKVIVALGEAAEGGEDLDVRISMALGELQSSSAKLLRLFLDEGYDWTLISSLLEEQVPAYTTLLDAGVPGEAIVGVLYSRKRDLWAAIHRGPDGREEGPLWAGSEALARRSAGLAGLLSQHRPGALTEQETEDRPGPDSLVHSETPDKPPRAVGTPGRPPDEAASADRAEPEAEEELPDWKILF